MDTIIQKTANAIFAAVTLILVHRFGEDGNRGWQSDTGLAQMPTVPNAAPMSIGFRALKEEAHTTINLGLLGRSMLAPIGPNLTLPTVVQGSQSLGIVAQNLSVTVGCHFSFATSNGW